MDAHTVLQDALAGANPTRVSGEVVPDRLLHHSPSALAGSPVIDLVARETSGARLEFSTIASRLELDFTLVRTRYTFFPPFSRDAVIEVEADGRVQRFAFADEGDVALVDEAFTVQVSPGAPSTLQVELGPASAPRDVTVWLPHTHGIRLRDLRADAPVAARARNSPRWVHYGSSISHCSEADGPRGVWPTITARSLGLDLTNLGFGGNALLDDFAAKTIRDLPADIITAKVGINVMNTGGFRIRTFVSAVHAFLDRVREGHPTTPLIVISPILCPAHEQTPGPTEWGPDRRARGSSLPRRPLDGQLTLEDVRVLLAQAVDDRRGGDPALHYLDGRELFGAGDLDHLPDGLHPDTEGYARIGERMSGLLPRWL